MSYCDGIITQGLPKGDCVQTPAKGYERVAVLINRADVDFTNVAMAEGHPNVITSLGLIEGKKGFEVHQLGKQPFAGSTSSLSAGTYYNGVNKNFVIAVLNNDREVQSGLGDPLLNGEYIAVVERKDKGKDNASAFEVLGFHNGLQISAYEADPYGDVYGGGLYTLTEENAPVSRVYLGETYEAGKALFESLK